MSQNFFCFNFGWGWWLLNMSYLPLRLRGHSVILSWASYSSDSEPTRLPKWRCSRSQIRCQGLGPCCSLTSMDSVSGCSLQCFGNKNGSYLIHTSPWLLCPSILLVILGSSIRPESLSGDDNHDHWDEVWLTFPGEIRVLGPQNPLNLLHCSSPTLMGLNVDTFLCSKISTSGRQRTLHFS